MRARIRQCVVLPTMEFPVVGERIAIVCLLEPWRKVKPFRDDIARQGITQEVTQQIPVNGRIACDLYPQATVGHLPPKLPLNHSAVPRSRRTVFLSLRS